MVGTGREPPVRVEANSSESGRTKCSREVAEVSRNSHPPAPFISSQSRTHLLYRFSNYAMSDYCVGQGQNLNRELPIAEFIRRWSNLDGGQERANYSLFLAELCDVIGVRRPDPALAAHDFNDYVFERRVERKLPDGRTEAGRIDLYKRGCFILEAKQSRLRGGKKAVPEGQTDLFDTAERGPADTAVPGLDHVMVHARRQAEAYATKLPADHPYPPGCF